jgi:hypothetical protein
MKGFESEARRELAKGVDWQLARDRLLTLQ